jgi:hypothetical protein
LGSDVECHRLYSADGRKTGKLKGIWKEMVIPYVTILESGKTENKSVTTGSIDIENWSIHPMMLKDYRCKR